MRSSDVRDGSPRKMLNRTGWRYLSSRCVAASSVLAVRVEFHAPARLAGRAVAPLAHSRAATNRASCVFFFRRCARHASSSSSSPPPESPSSPSIAADRKRGMRETSPLTSASPTESSRASEFADDHELGDASTETPPVESLSWKERAKTFALEYGRVGIATHIVLSAVSFSVIYAAVSSGVDVSGLLHAIGLSTDSAGKEAAATSAGSFILAYAVYKVAAPLRWPLTFAVTPVVMRALRRRGYMLPKTKSNDHRSPRPDPDEPMSGDGRGTSC